MQRNPLETGWVQELSIRRTIPMSSGDFNNLSQAKLAFWLAFLEGEKLEQDKMMKEARKKKRR